MSRYTGPRVKKMRALGTDLPGLSVKKIEKRPYPPGQHGQARKKISEYGRRLHEKQKLRFNYGLSESHLRRLVFEARGSKTAAGKKLLELIERRLDNVVFRAGFARTIPAARQLVSHGHILVNGKRLDIASYRVRTGDKISVKPSHANSQTVEQGLSRADLPVAPWLEVAKEQREAVVKELPDETSIMFTLDVQLVVEYYSQRL